VNYTDSKSALKQYQQVGVQAAIADATPHRLILLLMQGALEKIATAKGYTLRGNSEKGSLISEAISILDGLRESLNFEVGGEIAENLELIYDYCQRRLLEANIKNDPVMLDEVYGLLREIKLAWEAIPDAMAPDQGKRT
jgi:flagellar secretion chaperone FliS